MANLISDLKAISVPPTNKTVLVLGGAALDDGQGGTYHWISDSTATGDDAEWVTPASSPAQGRWRRISRNVEDYATSNHTHAGVYQPSDQTLTGLAGLDGSAGVVYQTGEDLFTKRAVGTTANTIAAGDHTHATLVPTSRTITTQHSLTGGGDLSANRTLNLIGDTASPGNSKFYGTNSSGTRGWYDAPTGGAVTSLDDVGDVAYTGTPSDAQALVWSSGAWRNATIAAPTGSGTAVDTIAAMTAIAAPSANQMVYVRGFYNAGDGGGGMFMWDSASTETADGGTIFQKDGGGTGRWKRDVRGQNRWSAKWFGARGTGVVNDTAAIQAALDTGLPIFLPRGLYWISSLLIRPGKNFMLEGEHQAGDNTTVRLVVKTDPSDEAAIHREEGWLMSTTDAYTDGAGGTPEQFPPLCHVQIKNLDIWIGEDCGLKSAIDVYACRTLVIDEVKIQTTFRGITRGFESFDSSITNVNIDSFFRANYPKDSLYEGVPVIDGLAWRAWGIHSEAHTHMSNICVVNCGVGVKMLGAGPVLSGARIEVCYYGVLAGGTRYFVNGPQSWVLENGAIIGISTEGCVYGVTINGADCSVFSGIRCLGHDWAHIEGRIGLYIQKADTTCTISNFLAKNYFAIAGLVNHSKVPVRDSYSHVVGGQTYPLTEGPGGEEGYVPEFGFLNTPLFPKADQRGHRSLTSFRNLMVMGLTGINLRDIPTEGDARGGLIFAKNLGGVVGVANGGSTATVSFDTAISRVENRIGTPTVENDSNSQLAPGIYYYAGTFVGKFGETAIEYLGLNGEGPSYFSVTVGEGQRVRIPSYQTHARPGYRRRLYRGTRPQQFSGFIDGPIGDFGVIYDDGTLDFSNGVMPPDISGGTGRIPDRLELDANYQIIATPSWGTTVHVTNKATTGFTLNFGTPAPDANQTVSWLLFRP